jgi:hypothetical protein
MQQNERRKTEGRRRICSRMKGGRQREGEGYAAE